MWDLLAGKEEGKLGLHSEPDLIRFNVSGTRFAVISHSNLTLYSTDMRPLTELNSSPKSARFHDVRFWEFDGKERMLVACEDGKVRVYDTSTVVEGQEEPVKDVAVVKGHSNRVKRMDLSSILHDGEERIIMTTISSDGWVNFSDLSSLRTSSESIIELEPTVRYDTKGMRLVCLAVQGVSKEVEADSSDDEDGSESEDEDEGAEVVEMSEEEAED
ncbi:hypothetical protein BT69DRAFT_1332173 [Atractiella rhizophila]|nr:hypothetical protein BT69DRAFT_1332173 [Atractiella rhizophila]